MLAIKSVLFPTDFSDHAERAFEYALAWAKQCDAEIHVLNIAASDAPESPLAYMLEDEEAPEEASETGVRTFGAPKQVEGVQVYYEQMLDEEPDKAILAYAAQHSTDLIIMGTRGQRGVHNLWSRSVAERVIRHATCPVLLMRTAKEPVQATIPQHIIVCSDLSERDRLAIAHGKELAHQLGARLTVLHVVEYVARLANMDAKAAEENFRLVRGDIKEKISAVVEGIGRPDISAGVFVLPGYPELDIDEFAERHNADLLVMTTHGRQGIARFFTGSMTSWMVRRASCPVFVVREFGKSVVEPEEETATWPDDSETLT